MKTSGNIGLAILFASLLQLAGTQPLLADSVTLISGQVVEGTILRETENEVVIYGQDGTVPYPRSLIHSVQRKGTAPDASPVERNPPAPPPDREAASGNQMDVQPSSQKRKMETIIQVLEGTTLQPWESESVHNVTEKNASKFKYIDSSGAMGYTDTLSSPPEKFLKVWIRQQNKSRESGFGGDLVWVRLWWHKERSQWLPLDPRLAAFHRENTGAFMILSLATGPNSSTKTDISNQAGLLVKMKNSPRELEKGKAKLQELCREAARDWEEDRSGGDLLYRILLQSVEIEWAPDMAGKIRHANERRALLKELVRIYQDR